MKKIKPSYTKFKKTKTSYQKRLKGYFSKNFNNLKLETRLKIPKEFINKLIENRELFFKYIELAKKYKRSNWIEILNLLGKKILKEKIEFKILKNQKGKIIRALFKGKCILEGNFLFIKKIENIHKNYFGFKIIKYYFVFLLEVIFYFMQEKKSFLENQMMDWKSENCKILENDEKNKFFEDNKNENYYFEKNKSFDEKTKKQIEEINETNLKKETNFVKESNFGNESLLEQTIIKKMSLKEKEFSENQKIEDEIKNLIFELTNKKSEFKILEIKNKNIKIEEVYYKFKNFENCQYNSGEELFKKIIKIFYKEDLKYTFIKQKKKFSANFKIPRLKIKLNLKISFSEKEKKPKMISFLIFFRKIFPQIFLRFLNLFEFLKIDLFGKFDYNKELFDKFKEKKEKYCVLENKEISDFHFFKNIKKKIFDDFSSEALKNFEINSKGNFQIFLNLFLKIDYIFKLEILYENNLFCLKYELNSKTEKKKKNFIKFFFKTSNFEKTLFVSEIFFLKEIFPSNSFTKILKNYFFSSQKKIEKNILKINLKSEIKNYEILYQKNIEKEFLEILSITKIQKYILNFDFAKFIIDFTEQIKTDFEIKIDKIENFSRFLFQINKFNIFSIDVEGKFSENMKNAACFIFLKKIFPSIYRAFIDLFLVSFKSIDF